MAAYLHSIHIIHRDLKPRNVLVSSRLRAHVIDLGLAIDMSDLRYARIGSRSLLLLCRSLLALN